MFKLALELGCTVSDLESRLSVAELREWVAYSLCDPFGTWREDFNSAKICASMAGGRISDYMPDFNPAPVTLADKIAMAKQWVVQHNGVCNR